MKYTTVVIRLGLCVWALGSSGLYPSVALAGAASGLGAASEPSYQNAERDGLFPGGDDGINPFDLLHRSRLRPSRSAEEFATDGDEQLDAAGAEFRRQQQQRLNCTSTSGETSAAELSVCAER